MIHGTEPEVGLRTTLVRSVHSGGWTGLEFLLVCALVDSPDVCYPIWKVMVPLMTGLNPCFNHPTFQTHGRVSLIIRFLFSFYDMVVANEINKLGRVISQP